MGQSEIFSIRQMIELTGLSEFTIRGWENRYSAFDPHRSDTGRREYSKNDVERALILRELLKRGHRIGQVAHLSNQKLLGLFEQTVENRRDENQSHKSKLVSEALELMALQKWTELSLHFKQTRAQNTNDLVNEFFLPLLTEFANQVQAGTVSIAQEHVFSSFIKEKIYSVLSDFEIQKAAKSSRDKIRFVLATPEGDFHEIGLLLAHLLIRSKGFTSLFLGPHTPAQDLSETALRFEASHLLIVSTTSKKQGARQDVLHFVRDVQKKIGPSMQILLAGKQVPHIQAAQRSTLLSVSSFHDFESYLQSLKK